MSVCELLCWFLLVVSNCMAELPALFHDLGGDSMLSCASHPHMQMPTIRPPT